MEDESSSIKCAATNFKNELTLFFLKDINQLKPTYIASIQIQYTHQSITNRKSFIPKPILRASFQKQLALDQSKTDAHSINAINLHGIGFLSVGYSDLKTFILRSMAPILSFCAEPKAKSQNP